MGRHDILDPFQAVLVGFTVMGVMSILAAIFGWSAIVVVIAGTSAFFACAFVALI